MRYRTVAELVEALLACDQDAEPRLAIQPSWPFEHSISMVEEAWPGDDVDPDRRIDETPDGRSVVYITEGSQLGYLPGFARDAIGW